MIREYIAKISDEVMEEEIADRPQELIRCNGCKYINTPASGVPFCKRIKKFVDADWFCADGKRR